jgi:hypothetical protein
MSFGFSGATDRDRYRFLSGFKLNDQGKNEDPTYLGFSMDFDFGLLGIDREYGTPVSPLFKDGSYDNTDSLNIFGQLQYSFRSRTQKDILFYSAQTYLENRETSIIANTFPISGGKRSQMLKQFKILLRDITKNQPWFFQSIEGLDSLYKVARGGFQDQDKDSEFNPSRAATITVTTLESLNLRITALADLYNHATFDFINMRETVPRNLRRFRMYIYVTDLRNFFKTNRLINSSTTLTAIANTANLIGSGINPGNSLSGTSLDSTGNFPDDTGAQGGAIGNTLSDIARSEGLTNQQDQTGIKPIILIECSNCEFDFTESSPIPNDINAGTDSGTPLGQSFKIHVGRVKIRSQYPNIRLDKNPLVISDDVFTNKSSVQNYSGDPSGRTVFGIGLGNGPAADLIEQAANIGTNLIGNTVNDLYDRGVQMLTDPLSGADQLMLGNVYSFNPSEVMGFLSGNSSNLSLNSIRDFYNQSAGVDIGSALKNGLPNPQTMGKGGPPENTYPLGILTGGLDLYPGVPGKDLGVTPPGSSTIGRVYPFLRPGDEYKGVPGQDLGVPGRVYPPLAPTDAYTQVPGQDLGLPGRVYPLVAADDVYSEVPGEDLGVPQRVYPDPSGDVYPNVPGSDLGGSQRVYPTVTDDFYPDVPGVDLGVPNRVYPQINDDVYTKVPGKDLGVPERAYPIINDDVYSEVPGKDLGAPERAYPIVNEDVYPDVPGSDLGLPGRKYGGINENVYPNSSSESNQLKSPERVYEDEPTKKSNLVEDVYKDDNKNLTEFTSKPTPVYPREETKYFKGNLGDLYPPTREDFNPEEPGDLGNLKTKDSYNISLGGKNPDPTKFDS